MDKQQFMDRLLAEAKAQGIDPAEVYYSAGSRLQRRCDERQY